MNILTLLRFIPVVVGFLASRKAEVEKLVLQAEAQFPGASTGIQKLAHVIGGIFAIIQDIGGTISSVPPDILLSLLSGHISAVVTKLIPPSAPAALAQSAT